MDLFATVKKSIEGRLGHEITRRNFFNDILGTVAGSSLLSLPGIRSLANGSSQESSDPASDVVSPDDGDWFCLVEVSWPCTIHQESLGVYAKWESGRYWYDIEDDFEVGPGGESCTYDLSRKSSARPLTFFGIIELLHTSKCIEMDEEYSRHGLIENYWEAMAPYSDFEASPGPTIYSAYYPELAAWYECRWQQWCLEKKLEGWGKLFVKNETGETILNPDLVGYFELPDEGILSLTSGSLFPSFDLQWRPTSYDLSPQEESHPSRSFSLPWERS